MKNEVLIMGNIWNKRFSRFSAFDNLPLLRVKNKGDLRQFTASNVLFPPENAIQRIIVDWMQICTQSNDIVLLEQFSSYEGKLLKLAISARDSEQTPEKWRSQMVSIPSIIRTLEHPDIKGMHQITHYMTPMSGVVLKENDALNIDLLGRFGMLENLVQPEMSNQETFLCIQFSMGFSLVAKEWRGHRAKHHHVHGFFPH